MYDPKLWSLGGCDDQHSYHSPYARRCRRFVQTIHLPCVETFYDNNISAVIVGRNSGIRSEKQIRLNLKHDGMNPRNRLMLVKRNI